MSKSLQDILDKFSSEGKNYFTLKELQKNFKSSKGSISVGLSRLAKIERIKMIRQGFGIILDANGIAPHPSYYIDAMMKHLDVKYYVSTITAAAYWGASHQASMSFQIITDKVVKDTQLKKTRFEFITKKETFPKKGIVRVSGIGGYYLISSPELTSLDLIRYYKKSGYFNNIATMIFDLVPKWDGRKMTTLCNEISIPATSLQRLGYLLDEVILYPKEVKYIEKALEKKRFNRTILLPLKKNKKRNDYLYNEKWKLYINSTVEPD